MAFIRLWIDSRRLEMKDSDDVNALIGFLERNEYSSASALLRVLSKDPLLDKAVFELAKEWACQSFEENLWKGRPLNRKSALLFVLSEKLMEGGKGESTIRNRLCSIMYV